MSRDSIWTNPDGLTVGFGSHSPDNQSPRVLAGPGQVKYMEMEIDAARLDPFGTVTTSFLFPQTSVIRRGSRITRAHLLVNTIFTGATAVLLVGTYKNDGQPAGALTVDLINGIINATDGALANLNGVGEITIGTGGLIGTTTTAGAVSDSDVIVVAQCTTAQFTAGRATLFIEYIEPTYSRGGAISGSVNIPPAYTN